MAASGRLRLFCALRLADETIAPVVRWQERELRGGRIVPPAHLHLTLAFLGAQDAAASADTAPCPASTAAGTSSSASLTSSA